MTKDKQPSASRNFWKTRQLEDLTAVEWEALCDGCARCCLYKLEDEDGSIYFTRVVCRYLDLQQCRCTEYARRSQVMPTCVHLTPENVHELTWLPPTCAYRLLALGYGLPPWHPLVSGSPESIHAAGVSVREVALPEQQADLDNLEDYVVDWFDGSDTDRSSGR